MPSGGVPHCMDMSLDGTTVVVDDTKRECAIAVHFAADKTTVLKSDSRRAHIAISDLSKAIELKPGDAALHRCRGIVHAGRADRAESAKDLEKAIELPPNMVARIWYELAMVKLAAGDDDGYAQTCAAMLSHFGEIKDPNEARFMAWACVLSPTSDADWSAVIALAKRATKVDAEDGSLGQTALGAALYRADRFDYAVAQLTLVDQQIQQAKPESSSCPAYTWFFRVVFTSTRQPVITVRCRLRIPLDTVAAFSTNRGGVHSPQQPLLCYHVFGLIRSDKMKITILQRDDMITHVVLSGRLDTTGADEIGDVFSEATAGRERSAIVDLS